MKFNFLEQREIRIEYQVIFLYIFIIDNSLGNQENILLELIHSDHFKHYGRPSIVKQSAIGSDQFLQGAFVLDNLDIAHFQRFSKEGIMRFFEDCSQSDSWGDDKEDFVTLVKNFKELISKETSDSFFLISKDWFNQGDQILNADNQFYTYYFLVLWSNMNEKTLNVCEWNGD